MINRFYGFFHSPRAERQMCVHCGVDYLQLIGDLLFFNQMPEQDECE